MDRLDKAMYYLQRSHPEHFERHQHDASWILNVPSRETDGAAFIRDLHVELAKVDAEEASKVDGMYPYIHVGEDFVEGYRINTCRPQGMRIEWFETCIFEVVDKDAPYFMDRWGDSWVQESYDTPEEAAAGHAKYVKAMQEGDTQVYHLGYTRDDEPEG